MFQDIFTRAVQEHVSGYFYTNFTRTVMIIEFSENLTVKSIGNLIFKLDVTQ